MEIMVEDAEDRVDVPLSAEERSKLESTKSSFKATLTKSPNDVAGLVGYAEACAELGQLREAEETLLKLTKSSPTPDHFRLLGEVQSMQGSAAFKKASQTYAQGLELSKGDPSLDLVEGLTSTYVRANRGEDAVNLIKSLQAKATPSSQIGSVELRLLLAKTYSQWSGHGAEAEAVYNALIKERPSDYRIYLAKAVLQQEAGRTEDAQKSLVQARFYAGTREAKQLVDRIAAAAVVSAQ